MVTEAQGVSYEDLVADGVHGEGSVVGGEVRVGEGAGEFGGGEVAVVDLDVGARAEVGGEEEGAGGVGQQRHVGVDGAIAAVVDGDLRDAVVRAEGHYSNR